MVVLAASTVIVSLEVADAQGGILADHLVAADDDVGRLEGLEPLQADRDLVAPERHGVELVDAGVVGDGAERRLGPDVHGGDRGSGQHASARVGDGADQAGLRRELREGWSGQHQR